ncbi:MAG: adenylyltransferase/cytidyltransferase family protein [bacterium]|nr:adenylyltransferase/cytidyltransferase family protein [bacterium]
MRNIEEKIFFNWYNLKKVIEKYRSFSKVIGFTNGCFDILHKGHVSYLNEAKKYCDLLIVGLNSDESVKLIKGPNKPINSLKDRMYVIASLESVDFVTFFNETTPINLIEYILPDIVFKGGDYKDKVIPELDVIYKYNISFKTLVFLEDVSTTKIIKKILLTFGGE